jgi:flagellar assembly protein FliH
MTIYAEIEQKKSEMESSSLKFALGVIRKVLPSLERENAESEVKAFLAENFANFATQESLSFSFNPETISLVAESIGRLAEQNDFEGKIAVHKDASLGVSDCRVEWKSGGVERNTEKTLDKIEDLIENN